MSSESDEQFLDRLEATPRYNPAYRTLDSDRLFALARRGAAVTDQHAIGFREGAAHMHKAQADRIAQLEAALRECEATVVTHHAEDVARTDWSGSGMAQKKARAVATRSGLLMHNIMIIIRAALGEERT